MRHDAHARPVAERAAVAPSAPDLAALVAHYQRELRLLDWRLDVSYAPGFTVLKIKNNKLQQIHNYRLDKEL
jgi:hypothetical protein